MADEQRDPNSLVAKRLRYIERQRAIASAVANTANGVDGVNAMPAGQRPMGSGPVNRHGMPTTPVGQHLVPNWPVLDLGDVPRISKPDWRLEIGGAVANPVTLTWDDFMSLPQVDDVSDFHCVTTWSRLDNRWNGVRFRTLAELVVPADSVSHVLCTGYDHEGMSREPYTTNLPLARAIEEDVLLVHSWEGAPLPLEHGGPCRMITPKLYAWKGTKWIRKIEFLILPKRGFWEKRGYSDTAEPWLDDRYSR